MSNLAAQRKLVEQLRHEAAIDRKKVSQVCKELISFCEAHQQSDVLVSGFTSQKENPFKEKSGCFIIWMNKMDKNGIEEKKMKTESLLYFSFYIYI